MGVQVAGLLKVAENLLKHTVKLKALSIKKEVLILATTRQNVSSGVSDQARHKSACAAIEAS